MNTKWVNLGKGQVELTQNQSQAVLSEEATNRKAQNVEDAFFVADLGDIAAKYQLWKKELPRVEPFYAVKCNSDKVVLTLLSKLGVGFDCASKAEIQSVLRLKVPSDRIIYANPCKQTSHIKYSAQNDITLTTFDNASELYKIKQHHPNTRLLLRLLPPEATKAQCPLGMKYGCTLKEAGHLLELAIQLNLNVVGVSFHVGSGCYDVQAFVQAVELAALVFQTASTLGLKFTILDIGGGFPGQSNAPLSFQEICSALRPTLDIHFPVSSKVRIISEPGRFFVASAFKLAVNVIACRVTARDLKDSDGSVDVTGNDEPHYMYYVNDGVYGSFNCLLYDHAVVKPKVLVGANGDGMMYSSSVWGPTCDGLDCLNQQIQLPKLDVGCWLMYEDMGAYTISAASGFNGMPPPTIQYMISPSCWNSLGMKSCSKPKKVVVAPRQRSVSCGSNKLRMVEIDLLDMIGTDKLAQSSHITTINQDLYCDMHADF